MKTNGIVLLFTLLLAGSGANAQYTDINRLMSESITLSRTTSNKQAAHSPSWTLVETALKQVNAVEFKPGMVNVIHAVDPSTIIYPPPTPAPPPPPKRRYSIRYGGLTLYGDYQWLQLEVTPVGGMGFLKDLGQMSWSEVDRMPALMLEPIAQSIQISSNQGEPVVGPEGVIVKARTGHVYAVHIKDEGTDFRALFRIESIDTNGNCKISWKRIPTK